MKAITTFHYITLHTLHKLDGIGKSGMKVSLHSNTIFLFGFFYGFIIFSFDFVVFCFFFLGEGFLYFSIFFFSFSFLFFVFAFFSLY